MSSSSLTPERRLATTTSTTTSTWTRKSRILTLLMTLSLILSSLATPVPSQGHSNLLKSPPVKQMQNNNKRAVKANNNNNNPQTKPITNVSVRTFLNPIANARPAAAGHPRPLLRRPVSQSQSRSQSQPQTKAKVKQVAAPPPAAPAPAISEPQPIIPAAAPVETTTEENTDPLLPEHKYFHEPGYTESLSHYDSRFFGSPIPYDPHIVHLRHLIRSYLLMTSSRSLQTWLAHGTLLGWYWNGRIMPWDYDLDVQVSNATLGEMAREWNGTVYEYFYTVSEEEVEEGGEGEEKGVGKEKEGEGKKGGEKGGEGLEEGEGQKEGEGRLDKKKKKKKTGGVNVKKYMLDVNPYWAQRTRLDGLNIIDARWIDMETGMYVDITGLSEDRLETAKEPETKGNGVGVWTDKNYHGYGTGQIWPLRRTEFEGVEAWVPSDVEGVLEDEYGGRSLTAEEWAGHHFDHGRKEWVKTELVKKGS